MRAGQLCNAAWTFFVDKCWSARAPRCVSTLHEQAWIFMCFLAAFCWLPHDVMLESHHAASVRARRRCIAATLRTNMRASINTLAVVDRGRWVDGWSMGACDNSGTAKRWVMRLGRGPVARAGTVYCEWRRVALTRCYRSLCYLFRVTDE